MTGVGVREVSSQAHGSAAPKSRMPKSRMPGRSSGSRAGRLPGLARGAALLLLVGLCGVPAALAESEEPQAPGEALYVSEFPVAETGDLKPGASIVGGGRPLSVAEAVALSIRNNLDVEVERYTPLIAGTERDGAWGAYDPMVSASVEYDVVKSPNTSAFNPDVEVLRDSSAGGGIGVDQMIPYVGASIGVRYEASEQTTRSQFFTLDPQYNQSVFLNARVPLLRGLIWNEAWTNVKVSGLQYGVAREGFRASLMDNVQTTVNAYWDLVAARDQVRVAQKSLETARALLEQTKTQYEVGVVSRVEVVEAEAGVADREFELIRTANQYRNAQDSLIDIVLGRELRALTELEFSPTEDPESYQERAVDVDRAVRTAFDLRPELAQISQQIEQREVDLKFAKNQRLPQLDADFSYGFVGISGNANPGLAGFGGVAPDLPPSRDFSRATDDWFTSDGADNYRVTGTFSIPFPNTTARKRVVRSDLELRRSKTSYARLEQSIILEVRNAARNLMASAQGIQAAERRRLAAEEQLRAERIRLEHGESTPFEVLQRESDLVEAESQKITALQTYRASEIALERAQGTILDFHDVIVDAVGEPVREPLQ